ncbi:MAG: NUDIX hydrolase [Beijerinckiaceae bacterium]
MTVEITPLQRIDAVLEPAPWEFAITQAEAIKAHWEKLLIEKPRMFNGTVLMQHRWSIENGVYTTAYTPVDFASFISWQHFGYPGSPCRNGFAMAALRAADGAFLLGVMGQHTANAGKIYFAGGTPDMNDVTSTGQIDLAGSMTRELFEETGLRPDEVTVDDAWVVVTDAHRAAFLKPARTIYKADEAREIMLSRIAVMEDQELADIAIVRSPADINEAMTPPFARHYMQSVFAAETG